MIRSDSGVYTNITSGSNTDSDSNSNDTVAKGV